MKAQFTVVSALILSGLLACTSISGAAEAKGGKKGDRKGGPSVEQTVDRMSTNLNLTADQKAKVKDLFEKQAKERKEAREQNQSLTPEQRREKMAESRKAMDAEMKKILTPEQYEKWQKTRPAQPASGEKNGKAKGKKAQES